MNDVCYHLSAGTPPLGSTTGMTTFTNLPALNLAFTLTVSVQPRCGQPAFDLTRGFRRGIYHRSTVAVTHAVSLRYKFITYFLCCLSWSL